MTYSPLYVPPEGTEGKSLAGVESCGCITAAFAVRPLKDWPHGASATERDVGEFYVDMAKTGRTIEWVADDVIRARLFRSCSEQHPLSPASGAST